MFTVCRLICLHCFLTGHCVIEVFLSVVVIDELITCRVNDTFERREQTWIQISQLINQPILVRNSSIPDNKWSIYNSFFVAVTAVTTIGIY